MTPLEFHNAMRPRLEALVCTFVHTELGYSQQQDLMAHYRKFMTTAFCLEAGMPSLLPRLMRLQTQQSLVSVLIADLVSVFFMTTERYHTIDNTGSLTLRVNTYEARLKRFLAKLTATLQDYQLSSKSKAAKPKLKNGNATTTPLRYVTEVTVRGIALKI